MIKPVLEKNILILLCLLMPCIFSFVYPVHIGVVHADYPDMDMTATPNPVGSGARALGMGGAFISVADDATAASWNPGALLRLKRSELSIVGSYYSGRMDYDTGGINGEIEDHSPNIYHLNYLSAAFPYTFLKRNMVFSINYQHLYEFSIENQEIWREEDTSVPTDLIHNDCKQQKGSLSTISPALAVQVLPSLSIGATFNLWERDALENGWQNLNIQDAQGIDLGSEMIRHSEIYERYRFSGFNMHWGFLFTSKYHTLWGGERRFRIGGVLKTPFTAHIRNEKHTILHEEYPGSPNLNNHQETLTHQDLRLKMPLSYGVGISLDLSDSFSTSLDVYCTHWDQYVMVYPSGAEVSPINKEIKSKAGIAQTTQVRLGCEYLMTGTSSVIPVRVGAFYDPEPARGNADDFYGVSIGTGILYGDISFDIAYQYRFGTKRRSEFMLASEIPSDVKQHYFYSSLIFYF